MNKEKIILLAEQFINESPKNHISEEDAISANCVGMQIYDAPIFGFGSVDDELYSKFKSPDVIDSDFLCPTEWMLEAKTVISFFLPYTGKIKKANSPNNKWPADEWINGRHEGQLLLQDLMLFLEKTLSDAGYKVVVPSLDEAFTFKNVDIGGSTRFLSNWSERHIAYACGLGTFGLSKGLITRKGMCGRFGSLITDLDLPKDKRDYNDVYEYCSMCGACAARCPAKAISLDNGKNSLLCSEFLSETRKKYDPRYGCGKCQVGVPCESKIPMR